MSASLAFLKRYPAPVDCITSGDQNFVGYLLQRVKRLSELYPGAAPPNTSAVLNPLKCVTGSGPLLNSVVTTESSGNHVLIRPIMGAHIYLADIVRAGPVFRQCLRLYPVNTAKFNKIVDVQIAKISLHGVEDFRNGYPSASARSRSTWAYSRGALTRKLVLAAAIAGCSTALATNSWATAANSEKSPPLGSCNWSGETPGRAKSTDRGSIEGQNKGLRNFCKFLKGGCDQAGNLFGRMLRLSQCCRGMNIVA